MRDSISVVKVVVLDVKLICVVDNGIVFRGITVFLADLNIFSLRVLTNINTRTHTRFIYYNKTTTTYN